MTEKWIKIKLFTSTWKIWRDTATTSEKYDKDLDAIVEMEETEEHENPVITYIEDFHGFTHTNGRLYEMVCIVPAKDKNKMLKLWKELTEKPLSVIEKLDVLVDYVSQYDTNPIIRFYTDSDKLEIEIN